VNRARAGECVGVPVQLEETRREKVFWAPNGCQQQAQANWSCFDVSPSLPTSRNLVEWTTSDSEQSWVRCTGVSNLLAESSGSFVR
jgi:hypothetical protein